MQVGLDTRPWCKCSGHFSKRSHPCCLPAALSCLPLLSAETCGWSHCLQVVGAVPVTDWSSIHFNSHDQMKWHLDYCHALFVNIGGMRACGGVRYHATSVLYNIMRWSHLRSISWYRLMVIIIIIIIIIIHEYYYGGTVTLLLQNPLTMSLLHLAD